MAREAQLLVTVGRGRVWSVGMFKAKLRMVIKGTDYPFVRVKSIYYMIVNKSGIAPSWSPRATRAESVRVGVLLGANVE